MNKVIDGKLNPKLGLVIDGNLDLTDTNITELPEDLKVGDSLYLKGTNITNYPVVYNCGDDDRAIYLDLNDRSKIRIGCFIGTRDEAIDAIKDAYSGVEAEEYINKVLECFDMDKLPRIETK